MDLDPQLFVPFASVVLVAAKRTSTGSKCLKPKKGWRGWITWLVMKASGC